MPARFQVLSDPVEEMLAAGVSRSLSETIRAALWIKDRAGEVKSFVYSDTFSHRFAEVVHQTFTPGTPLSILLASFVGLLLLRVLWTANEAKKMMKKYGNFES